MVCPRQVPCPAVFSKATRTAEDFVAWKTSSRPETMRASAAVSPDPRCAPGCITRNGRPTSVARLISWMSDCSDLSRLAHGGAPLRGQLLRVQRQVCRRVGLAEPLHVVFDEKLHHLAADAGASLQGLPN